MVVIELKKSEAVIAIVCVTIIGGALALGLGDYQSFTERLGLGESNLWNSQAEGKDEIVTKITSETKTTVTATVSNPEGLDDLSCQNLEDVISEFLPVMEASIIRRTTGNQTHYWVSYDTRGADQAAGILQVYLSLYLINNCQGLEYPIIRDLFIKHSDLPEAPAVKISGSPTFLTNGTISIYLLNSGAQSDKVSSISTAISGTMVTVTPTSGATVYGGGSTSNVRATFTNLPTSSESYLIVISFESGKRLSAYVIAKSSEGGVQNQTAQSSIAIETITFSGSTATVYFRNVGAVSITPALLTAQGMSSNSGFTGTATNSTNLSSGSIAKGAGGSNAMTLSGLTSGDVVTFKITTTVGTFAQGTYTVP